MLLRLEKAKVWNGALTEFFFKTGEEFANAVRDGDERLYSKELWGVVVPWRRFKAEDGVTEFRLAFVAPFEDSPEEVVSEGDPTLELDWDKCPVYYHFKLLGQTQFEEIKLKGGEF